MTRDERIKALLARGYLPKELPPPFSSDTFANSAYEISPLWSAYQAGLTGQQRKQHPPISQYSRFDMARKGHSRRTLGVPNPINQYYISECIADHQDSLENISAKSPISLTSCKIEPGDGRAVSMPRISTLAENRIKSYSTARTILQTDVLSFYHAIYTHSIPWALHGKQQAKRNRNASDPAFYGNRIDALIRSCQDGQTIGLPVGPDTSRIISEIILCAIEEKIGITHFNSLSGGYRYMDDFFLCFASPVQAEIFLSALRQAVLSFDLQLNASKTHIIDALSFNEERWPSRIAEMTISQDKENQHRDLMRFFTDVIDLAKSHPDESISSFAVRKTSRLLINSDNWELYESFLIRIARENSNCLDSVVKILCTYAACGYKISEKVKIFAEDIIDSHAPYNHHYEITWILWLCRSLSIRLSEKSTQLVSVIENSLCACLFMMMRSRTLLTGRSSVLDWTGKVDTADLMGEHWMLVYEAGIRKSWNLPGAIDAINSDPYFSILRDKKVSFFNNSATNIPLDIPSVKGMLKRSLGKRRSAILNGAIYFEKRKGTTKRKYEKLGEDYGTDSSWPEMLFLNDDDDDDLDF